MNARLVATLCFTLCFTALLVSGAFWTEKTSSPSRFPYEVGTANNLQMDLPIPVATNRTFVAYQNTAGGQVPGPAYQTNMIIWSSADPRYGEEGYWPTYHSASVFANGKYYISAGVGPNANLASIYGMSGADGKSISMGYMWPSNTWPNGDGYSYNRQSGFSVYDPAADTWQSASWQLADLNGYCIESGSDPAPGTYVNRKPMRGQGTWIGANQAFAYDWDGDGVEEIFMHGGYPHWDGYCAVFDPNRGTDGEWTTTAAANNFSGGLKAQMYGGAVRVGTRIYCIGGNYWGPDGATHMQAYDPVSNVWQTYEYVYNKALRGFGIASVGTKIYMFSGVESPTTNYSPHVYMIDVANDDSITSGVRVVGDVVIPVQYPSMVSWKGVLYIVGGLTPGGPTNVFQIFNPATEATILSAETLPVNAYAASCSISTSGMFYFGGAMRMVDPVSGWLVNSGRMWSGPMPEQDMFIAPNVLSFWQATNNLVLRFDNATGLPIACTNTPTQGWVSVAPGVVTVPGGGTAYATVTVNRAMINGPTNAGVNITWSSGTFFVPVLADTPRPIATLTPTATITMQPRTKSFALANVGTTPMYFTNTSADAFVTAITPGIGVLAPAAQTSISFTITAAAPRPSIGTIQVAYNAYNGASEVFTISNYPAEFYVAVDGNNANNGLTWATAWRTIAFGLSNTPNGSADEGAMTLHVGAGTYANECSIPGTNLWSLHVINRSYLRVLGAGAQQSIIVPGTNIWPLVRYESDRVPSRCPLELRNLAHVEVSGFTIVATNPPARALSNVWDSFCAIVGILNVNGLYMHHMNIDGTYTGNVYLADEGVWTNSWYNWVYYGIAYHGLTGPYGARFENILLRGTQRAFSHNNYGYTADTGNTGPVLITHCTFVEQCNPDGNALGVYIHNPGAGYAPPYLVEYNILGDMPNALRPEAAEAIGLSPDQIETITLQFQMQAYSNQFWSIGVPVPGENWWNANVIAEDDEGNILNFTNEVPTFETVGGLPYSTQLETSYGTRDVGWNVVPEPAALGIVAFAVLALRRRR